MSEGENAATLAVRSDPELENDNEHMNKHRILIDQTRY